MNTSPFAITFPSLEAAVSHLGEKVLGVGITIQEPAAPEVEVGPQPGEGYRLLEEGEEIHPTDEWFDSIWESDWVPRESVEPGEILCLVENGGVNTPHRRKVEVPEPIIPEAPNCGMPTPPPERVRPPWNAKEEKFSDWLRRQHGKAEAVDEYVTGLYAKIGILHNNLADKDDTIKRLKEVIAERDNSHTAWRAAEEHVVHLTGSLANKDATIKRLKDKLAVTAEVMRDNIDLRAEVERLAAQAREAATECGKLKSDMFAYGQFTRDIASPLGCNISDIVLKWLKERDELKARVAELEAATVPKYRLLEVGEKIQMGDENYSNGNWVPSHPRLFGVSVIDCGTREEQYRNVGYYRRRIK